MKQTQWMIYTRRADFAALGKKYGISPVLARIMINRGIPEEDFDMFLNGSISDMHDPHLLKDADKAAGMILSAVREGVKIRIVGDYDIDGVTSTYILIKALTRLGADVSYDIPDRIRDGYGINENIIDKAHEDGIGLILTCDNGIAANSAIALAKSFGMTVIITDHHEIQGELPNADAIVNPHQTDCAYPFKAICGGMVAYKLVYILYEKAGIDLSEWEALISFAALATVGDIMPLIDENRIAVRTGLERFADCNNPGLNALIRLQGLSPDAITAYHLGFVIGPCLNAGGRLESAKIALGLLLAQTPEEAEEFAVRLKALNDERKSLTAAYTDVAEKEVEANFADDDVKVIYLPKCHESVAGIIAGRIRELYNHPVIVLTDSESGLLKGSARSIESYNIFEKLCEVKDIFEKFGGHRMAAGMSLKKEKLKEFRSRLNQNSGLEPADFIEKIWIDTELPFRYLDEGFICQLDRLEPYGQANEKPTFAARQCKILTVKVMGRNHNLVKMRLMDAEGETVDALLFTDGDKWIKGLDVRRKIDLLYYPQVNYFNGRTEIQIVIKGVR